MPDIRTDLVDSMMLACWLVESGRANVYSKWGDEYADHYERTEKRSKLVGEALMARGIDPPVALVPGHTAWVESMVGSSPVSVPLGAALLQRLAEWTNVYVVSYLTSDPGEFLALGEAELLFPVPPRGVDEAEAFIPDVEPGDGPRFVIMTDIHIGAAGADELARAAVDEINSLRPDFVVCPGDLTDDGEPEQFALAKSILDGFEVPVYSVLGNHDAVRRSTRTGDGADLFSAAFGERAVDRVLDCGDVQVALVDSTDPTPSPFPDWDLNRGGFREDAGGVPGGTLDDGQADALATRLDASRPVLLIEHHELQPFVGFPPVQFGLRSSDSDALLKALSGFNLIGVIAGHTHRSALSRVGAGSVQQLEIPAVKDWPFCYTVVSVDGSRARAVVRQLADRGLVARRSQHLAPIIRNYTLGPLTALDHTFQ